MYNWCPFSYYGNKVIIASWIVSRFPKNYEKMYYLEPYFGSGAVYFYKKPGDYEIITDKNKNIITFFRVLKGQPIELYKKIKETLITEKFIRECIDNLHSKKNLDDITIAVSVFIAFNMSFGACSKTISVNPAFFITKLEKINTKLEKFFLLSKRIAQTEILNTDAIKTIIRFSGEKNLVVYLDPPYPDADQGPYKGFTRQDFRNLIYVLTQIKGNFLLSCYEKDWMQFPKVWKKHYFNTYTKNVIVGKKTCTKIIEPRQELLITNF